MTRTKPLACLLAPLLTCNALVASPREATPPSKLQHLDATFLTLNAENNRVTYRDAGGDVRTMPVSSSAALGKLRRLPGGQRVVLKYRVTTPGTEPTVEDVAKQANWKKRGIVLGALGGLVVMFWSMSWSDPL